jgi:hypothetical protein
MPTPPTARHRTPTHRPTSPTATDCVGRLMAGRQQTAPPQQRSSKDDTAHPHQPGAHPDPPHPDRAHSRRHHPAKAKVKFPLRNTISCLSPAKLRSTDSVDLSCCWPHQRIQIRAGSRLRRHPALSRHVWNRRSRHDPARTGPLSAHASDNGDPLYGIIYCSWL